MNYNKRRIGSILINNELIDSDLWPKLDEALKPYIIKTKMKIRGKYDTEITFISTFFPYPKAFGMAASFVIDTTNGQFAFGGFKEIT